MPTRWPEALEAADLAIEVEAEEKLGADPKARPAAWAWGLYRKAEALMAMGDFLGAVKVCLKCFSPWAFWGVVFCPIKSSPASRG